MKVTAIKSHGIYVKICWRLMTLALAAVAGAWTVSVATAQAASAPEPMPPPSVQPGQISMGAFYNGVRLHIEGTAPAGSGVLVVIEGSEKDEFFNRTGRVGPIWMTVDRIHVKHAPSIFLRFSSADIGSLLDREEVDKYQLDQAAIMQRIRILSHCKCSLTEPSKQSGKQDKVPDASYAKLLSADFLRLKEQEGTYREQSGHVNLVPVGSGTQYALDFDWPKKLPPGSYRVAVYACRGGKVVAQSAASLQLMEVGFPAYITMLASSKPWFYGIGSVLVAVLAGFMIDLITSRLRRKRRPRNQSEIPQPETPSAAPEVTSIETPEAETTHHG